MGSKPAVMKERAKMVHKVKGSGQLVKRVRYVVNGHGTMRWISDDGKVWPECLVEYGPEEK